LHADSRQPVRRTALLWLVVAVSDTNSQETRRKLCERASTCTWHTLVWKLRIMHSPIMLCRLRNGRNGHCINKCDYFRRQDFRASAAGDSAETIRRDVQLDKTSVCSHTRAILRARLRVYLIPLVRLALIAISYYLTPL